MFEAIYSIGSSEVHERKDEFAKAVSDLYSDRLLQIVENDVSDRDSVSSVKSLLNSSNSLKLALLIRHKLAKNETKDSWLDYWIKSKLSKVVNFNERSYIEANPDVWESGIDPTHHFLRFGIEENRPIALSSVDLLGKVFTLCQSDIFDPIWMVKTYDFIPRDCENVALFYILVGERLGLDPGPSFSTIAYLSDHHDVARAEVSPILHFCLTGKTEGRCVRPSFVANLADGLAGQPSNESAELRKKLPGRLAIEFKQLASHFVRLAQWQNAVNVYRYIIQTLADDATPGVYTTCSMCMRRMGNYDAARELLVDADARYPQSDLVAFELAQVESGAGNHKLALDLWLALSPDAIKLSPKISFERLTDAAIQVHMSFGLSEAYWQKLKQFSKAQNDIGAQLAVGVIAMRTRNWQAAQEVLGDNYAKVQENLDDSHNYYFDQIGKSSIGPSRFTEVESTSGSPIALSAKGKIAVYTAVFDNYDLIRPPLFTPDDFDFLCFSDKPVNAPGWKTVIVERPVPDPALSNRHVKINALEYLSEYDASIYIDANVLITGDIAKLEQNYCRGRSFVAWEHPERDDVYNEIEAIVTRRKANAKSMIEQAEFFSEQGLGRNTGLLEANVLFRKHSGAPDLWKMMGEWWSLTARFGGRDQPALGYLMETMGPRPSVWPKKHGDGRHSDFFVKLPHNEPQSQHSGRSIAPIVGKKTRQIVWLRREDQSKVASTLMRGQQLSGFASKRFSDRVVRYENETAISEIRESIVVLTKGFLKRATCEELESLASKRNTICADYVDDTPRSDIDPLIDVYVTSSIRQHLDLLFRYPNKIVHYVTHHTDPRLSATPTNSINFRVGYFGELVNARYQTEISDIVDFVAVDTKTSANVQTWLDKLKYYPAHYALRQHRSIDGFKPFLKGFTASVSGAIILTEYDESDVRYYLGADYPFLVQGSTLSDAIDTVNFAKEEFGSPVWQQGLEIMKSVRERCSQDQIARELSVLLEILEN